MNQRISVSRRHFLKGSAALGLSLVAGRIFTPSLRVSAQQPAGPYKLDPLPYAFDALEPHIDKLTMEIHHDRHHAAYVTNLNTALEKYPDLQKKTAEELISDLNSVPEAIRTTVRNNAGGHVNHAMFWQIMGANAGGEPTGELGDAIKKAFGDYAKFKDEFGKAATGRFGSGWAWLVVDKDGSLKVTSSANQDNPMMDGQKPIMGLDVWEHAYYLKYQNKRADYIAAWWNVVNWKAIAERYSKAIKK